MSALLGPLLPVAVAGAYALFTLAALIAWWLVGDAWWNQLVNLSTFWWLLPSLPLLLLAVVFRQWTAVVLLLVPAALLVWSYGGLFLPSWPLSPASAADRADLRVASYNLFVRAGDVAHAVDLVEEERPDVLLVQEVTAEGARKLTDRLADELPHHWFGEPDAFGGVGLFSRHPIEEVRAVPGAERFERPTAVVVVRVPDPDGEDTRRVQVVPLHLVAPCPVCGSFAARQRYEVESRSRQVSAILDALDPELPAVIGGDFNGTRRSDAYRSLAGAGFRDPHTEAGFGLGLTYPATHAPPGEERRDRAATDARSGAPPAGGTATRQATMAHLPVISFPVLRLDHVLVRGLVPVDARIGRSRASDHRPVVVDVAWPARAASG